jgi:hypothetical protein
MAKKKFKDTNVGKFLLNKIPDVVAGLADSTPVGNVIQAIIGGSELSEADKQVALEKLRLERAEIDGTTRRWVADARSSWLPANVRPLTLIFFSCAYVVGWFYGLDVSNISSLLMVIVGGYFGGRSVEKVFGNNKHK